MPGRSRLLATILLLGAFIFLLARTFSWQRFAFGASAESNYLSGLCSEFLNWAPGSEFLPRAQRLSLSGYPASSFHNIVLGIVSSADAWPVVKGTALLWWRPNVTRGFVLLEEGEAALQLKQHQGEEELIEQRRWWERVREEREQAEEQTRSRLPGDFSIEGGGSNETIGIDSTPAKEIDLFSLTNSSLAEGYGQEPVIQVRGPNSPSADAQMDALTSAFLTLAAQELAEVHWFVMLGDDAVLDVENLAGVLNRYDPAEPRLIGYDAFSGTAGRRSPSNKPMSGPAFAISLALARELMLVLPACLERQTQHARSDQKLYACTAELGVPLIFEPGFHADEEMTPPLERHAPAPFVGLTLAHDSFRDRLSGDNRTVALQPMVRYMREDPAGFLQHAVCVDRDLDLMLSVSWGRSVRLYPGVDGVEELLGPNGPASQTEAGEADPCRAPALLAAEDVKRLKGSGNTLRFESLYMRSQLGGEKADRSKCKSLHAKIQSVRIIRKAEMFASGSMYAGPGAGPHLRRQCCRYAFTDGSRTILNVGLSACLAGQTLTQEPDRWASPL
ncbi:hypothetical protein KFL_001390230 [Klebsormidium nitens]|uniref:Uncharacterized protein n=1 Tax=Klebsormidium nitens TaxID=105231 RepID=A0A1Y1HX35_KLENI|nr:hypothetical protein KFL_001390230 [Klebsormidium nitens]|eukprot:GAQ83205.1 hypothetical protein KFL_001390230 [Klebsormidium nitens]